MRNLLITILCLVSIVTNAQQLQFTTFHTKDNKETKNIDSAYYERKLTLNNDEINSVKVVETYRSNNKTKLIGTQKSFKEKIFLGQKIESYENGNTKSKEFYSLDAVLKDTAHYFYNNGKLKLTYYYPSKTQNDKTKVTDTLILLYQDSTGKRLLTNGNGYAEIESKNSVEKGNFKKHKKIGEWNGSFMDGKYTFVEKYQNNKLVSGITTDSTGTTYTYQESNFMVEPQYPGGITALRRFIANNFNYPEEAIVNAVNGSLNASFVISKTGKMTDLKITKDLGYGTAEAFLRVLRQTKDWSPGIMRGVPVRVQYNLPLKLNTE